MTQLIGRSARLIAVRPTWCNPAVVVASLSAPRPSLLILAAGEQPEAATGPIEWRQFSLAIEENVTGNGYK